MRTLAGVLLAMMIVLVGIPAAAQSFNPVIEENSVDGLLLGAEGSYKFLVGWSHQGGWLMLFRARRSGTKLGLVYGISSPCQCSTGRARRSWGA